MITDRWQLTGVYCVGDDSRSRMDNTGRSHRQRHKVPGSVEFVQFCYRKRFATALWRLELALENDVVFSMFYVVLHRWSNKTNKTRPVHSQTPSDRKRPRGPVISVGATPCERAELFRLHRVEICLQRRQYIRTKNRLAGRTVNAESDWWCHLSASERIVTFCVVFHHPIVHGVHFVSQLVVT